MNGTTNIEQTRRANAMKKMRNVNANDRVLTAKQFSISW